VNKRASVTTKTVKTVNYPDVLGAITGGQRLNLDVLQVAVSVRPPSVNAGTPFDAIVLLQNMASIDVDALIRLLVPEMDLAGHRGRFSTKLTRPIRIGLRPGEVGCANLPLLATHQTAPGGSYQLQVEIQAEQKQRGAVHVRDPKGGMPLSLEELSEARQQDIRAMQGLRYSVTTVGRTSGNKATLAAPFEILPPTISGLPQDLKPAYITLWSIADYPDEAMLIEKVEPITSVLLPRLVHSNVFFPLLKATQPRFEAAQFRLWAGECVAIAKLLTLVLEMGIPQAGPGEPPPVYPRWFVKLCRLLVQNPHAGSQIDHLVSESLYPELVYDAVMLGFTMLKTVTSGQFGSNEELIVYANQIVSALSGKGEALDFTHVYMPLVLAGLVSNTRITMPTEQTRDTVSLLATAVERRASVKDSSNKFVFDMADDLIERALEHF
jgi:hypothetical protein